MLMNWMIPKVIYRPLFSLILVLTLMPNSVWSEDGIADEVDPQLREELQTCWNTIDKPEQQRICALTKTLVEGAKCEYIQYGSTTVTTTQCGPNGECPPMEGYARKAPDCLSKGIDEAGSAKYDELSLACQEGLYDYVDVFCDEKDDKDEEDASPETAESTAPSADENAAS